MDDNYRLLKLLSLIVFTYEHQCGLKYQNDVDEAVLDEKTASALYNVCMWYAGAVKYHLGDSGDGEYSRDARELPGFVLDAVTSLSDGVVDMLGGMVKNSLGLGRCSDPSTLGRLWVEDVTATAWRLALANNRELWGTDIDAMYAQQHRDRNSDMRDES